MGLILVLLVVVVKDLSTNDLSGDQHPTSGCQRELSSISNSKPSMICGNMALLLYLTPSQQDHSGITCKPTWPWQPVRFHMILIRQRRVGGYSRHTRSCIIHAWNRVILEIGYARRQGDWTPIGVCDD